MPATTPDTRPERAEVPGRGIRTKLTTISGITVLYGWVMRLSVTGMFVQTDEPLPDDTEISIDFTTRLGNKACRLQLLGWVVHYHSRGVGVQFDRMSMKDELLLAQLVEEYGKKAVPESA